jgi:TonB-linked SusC/RagA family outer membrane protein
MKRRTLLVMLLAVVFWQFSMAQRTITGRVISADDNSPLPGVNVLVKSTTIGVITNLNGNYKVEVPADNNTLIFSFIGMKTQEVEITGSTIDISMELDATGLEEVVVTAMGISREKKALGYSVTDIQSEEIARSNNTNVVNSLSGKVAGVFVTSSAGTAGAASFVEIRGSSSISGNNRPLFVIDGIPVSGADGDQRDLETGSYEYGTGTDGGVAASDRIGDLNPDDIESMTILKGGAATALYGLRAGNGAIVITTKKGSNNQAMKVSFHSSVTFDKISQVPELQTKYAQGSQLDRNDYGGDLPAYFDPDAGFYNAISWGPAIDSLRYTTDPTYIPANVYTTDPDLTLSNTPMDEYMEKWDPNGRLVLMDSPFAGTKKANVYNPYDFFQTGITYKNSISISGGGETTTYFASYSNVSQEGVIPNNTYDKNSFKLSGSQTLGTKWKVSSDINYIRTDANYIQQGSNISGVMLGLLRTPPTFDNSYGYQFEDGSQRTYRNGGGYDNPYWTANNITFGEAVNRIIGNVNLSYQATEWLTFSYKFGNDYYNRGYRDFFEKGSNNFKPGLLRKYHFRNNELSSTLLASMNFNLGTDVTLNAMVGHNMEEQKFTWTRSDANGLATLGWNSLLNTSDLFSTEGRSTRRTAAFFSNVGISWRSMLFVDVTGRAEWSTTLPVDNNLFFFPSVSGGFIFTELPGLNDNSILSFGKIRASYAMVANDAPTQSTTVGWLQTAPGDGWTVGTQYPLMGYTGFSYGNTIPDATIEPEFRKSFEVGADLRFLRGRLTADIAYFKDVNDNNLISAPIAASSGHDKIFGNLATIQTTGIELLVEGSPVKTSDFEWKISVNFANPNTIVTKLAEGVDNVELNVGFTDPQVRAMVDQNYRTLYGTQWFKDEQGRLIIDPETGYPMQDAVSGILGVVPEEYRMGIKNTFTFKGVTVSALIDIKKGGQMWNGTKGALDFFGMSKSTEGRYTDTKIFTGVYGEADDNNNVVYLDASGTPLPDGAAPIANTKQMNMDENWYYFGGPGSGFTGPSEPYIEDTDWIRLKELYVSYRLPSQTLKNTFINGLEVYFSGRNLWLSTPYSGVDPETSLFGNSNAQGVDYFNMPGTKSYTLGLRLDF